ncbi:MAG: prepilin-type N-terminal cleavage/methylation domain-containing protein [Candidatus Hydrogenedens sp.]|nr:prepilin-type N-terminal cleavage/methylation domain-containing protein [Candidatus Hydrogenedens sp.]
MSPRSRNSGFTLAELLVASMLLSIVMSAVYTMLFTTLGASRSIDPKFDAHQQARAFMTVIQREVENMAARAEHLFEGDRDSVAMFVISEPMNVEDAEGRRLMRVRYRFNRSRGEIEREEALVETALPNRPPAGEKVEQERIKLSDREDFVVASNVSDFKVRYVWSPIPRITDAKVPPPSPELVYTTRHKEGLGLPQAIEVTLEFEDPDDRDHTITFQSLLPIHAPNVRYYLEGLNDRLANFQ